MINTRALSSLCSVRIFALAPIHHIFQDNKTIQSHQILKTAPSGGMFYLYFCEPREDFTCLKGAENGAGVLFISIDDSPGSHRRSGTGWEEKGRRYGDSLLQKRKRVQEARHRRGGGGRGRWGEEGNVFGEVSDQIKK